IPASTISKKVEAGEYSLKQSRQHYEKHVFGTPKYTEYRMSREAKGGNPQSILLIGEDEAQRIICEKHGTGIIKVSRTGEATNREQVSCSKVIGQCYVKGQYYDTNKAAIHYSKRGAHLVPIRGDDYD
ncbi:MAG: polymorphic toxin type 50 domain-containing protein, partial [Hungatella sp.]